MTLMPSFLAFKATFSNSSGRNLPEVLGCDKSPQCVGQFQLPSLENLRRSPLLRQSARINLSV